MQINQSAVRYEWCPLDWQTTGTQRAHSVCIVQQLEPVTSSRSRKPLTLSPFVLIFLDLLRLLPRSQFLSQHTVQSKNALLFHTTTLIINSTVIQYCYCQTVFKLQTEHSLILQFFCNIKNVTIFTFFIYLLQFFNYKLNIV